METKLWDVYGRLAPVIEGLDASMTTRFHKITERVFLGTDILPRAARILNSAVEVTKAFKEFLGLGETDRLRIASDKDFVAAKAVVQRVQMLDEALQQPDVDLIQHIDHIKDHLVTAQESQNNTAAVCQDLIHEELDTVLQKHKLLSLGRIDGEGKWSDGLADKCKIQELVEAAKETLVKLSKENIDKGISELDACRLRCIRIQGIFALKEDELIGKSVEMADALRVILSEYLAVALVTSEKTRDEKILKVVAIKGKANKVDKGKGWNKRVHKQLQAAIDKISKRQDPYK